MRPSGRARRRLVVLTVIIATLATSCTAPEDSAVVASQGPGALNATQAGLLPEHIVDFPTFDFGTYEQLMAQLRGIPVVVNLWASWCGPCREEAPAFARLARRYGDEIQFLGVDHQDQRDAAVAFYEQNEVPYPSVFDPVGDIHDGLGFIGLPDTIFYRADGSIASTWTGPIAADVLEEQIRSSVAGLSR